MHFIDITMFYAAEGGGVSTYLNAKAAWLRQRSRVRHSILSPNVRNMQGPPALVHVPGIVMPGVHGYRMPVAVAASARTMLRLKPDLIEAGDAGLRPGRRCESSGGSGFRPWPTTIPTSHAWRRRGWAM